MLPRRCRAIVTTHDPPGPTVVTGGAGAIGSVLVRAVLSEGAEVRVVDNLSGGRKEHLPSDPKLSLVVADLLDPPSFETALDGAETVWHLAANPDVRLGIETPRIDLDRGTVATFQLLEAVRRHDVRRVRFSSSSVVYGRPTTFPTPEDYGPLLPESQYGAAKLACEGLMSAYAHDYGITVHLFRFANIIGPSMTHGILFDLFEKLRQDPARLEVLGDGRQAKSYLRAEECVDGMRFAAARSSQPVNLFNLGSLDRISVREIAEKVVAAHGGRAQIEYTGGERGWVGDVPQQLLSVEKIGRLGWRPRLTSAQCVDRTIEELVDARRVRP